MSDPTGEIAKGIDGTANIITAVICTLTNDQPASVCSDPTITGIQQRFNSTSPVTSGVAPVATTSVP